MITKQMCKYKSATRRNLNGKKEDGAEQLYSTTWEEQDEIQQKWSRFRRAPADFFVALNTCVFLNRCSCSPRHPGRTWIPEPPHLLKCLCHELIFSTKKQGGTCHHCWTPSRISSSIYSENRTCVFTPKHNTSSRPTLNWPKNGWKKTSQDSGPLPEIAPFAFVYSL